MHIAESCDRFACAMRVPCPAMYIAQVGDQYIVKRMPLSGGGHDPSCSSYEPPDGTVRPSAC
ncbi:DUF1173 family protein (plasmid) [Mesorhizobium atlanticum]|uniref:DUF1173 family protein n=1 Tax=Mesorhizobium atlanticum TaxID=2233532 RepID=UPI0037039BB1